MTEDHGGNAGQGAGHADRVAAACWRQALKLLQRRLHSRRELADKLRQRGYGRSVVAATLAEAERLNLINDAAFAEAYRDELQRKGLGDRRVQVALRRRGVAAPAAAPDPGDERQRAVAALVRKRRSLVRESDPHKRREKLIRFLLGRGFAMDLVREIMADGDAER